MHNPYRTLLLSAVLLSTAAGAQTPPPVAAPVLRDPLSLPGDGLPPTLPSIFAPPPAPNQTPAARPALPPAPPMALALQAAQTAVATCQGMGFETGVAVINAAGNLQLGIQSDKAVAGRIYNAVRKGLVALEFGLPSSAVRAKLAEKDSGTLARVKLNMTLGQGAVPLFAGGKLVGAIGVSGAPGGTNDEICAAAGAAAIKDKLG